RDVATAADAVRRMLGVTFQSPSLDRKLTVLENLRHQGHLYGLRGTDLETRIRTSLERFGVADRMKQIVQTLSGGLQRRVEIAKGLLHDPRVLLLDEPSTGLDPGARQEMWGHLELLRRETGVTILVTTHLMDEAERCDALAIIDRGKIVAEGVPHELRSSIGGDCLTIQSREPQILAEKLKSEFGIEVQQLGESLRLEQEQGHLLVGKLMDRFSEEIQSISLGKPTLEDVFLVRTGHRFEQEEA
ncbi:MAG: ATP-binding cassette domain-containing protein, partial [Planctomycetaceae bacterium]|nr:ATP-binding cassette domain-containing protein [Planctomycetaceae bacterium]